MRHKTTQALYSYWNDLRGQRLAPRRFEIEPGSIGELLPDTFILERQDTETFPYRLAGTRLCERFKREFRGQNFLNSWSPPEAAIIRERLNSISVQGGAALFLIEAENTAGKTVLMETIVLPLVHMHPVADRYLGTVSTLDTPDWLGFEPISVLRLLRDEIIWPDGRPHAAVVNAGHQAPFLPHLRKARIVRSERRQFRVFDGGLADTRPGQGPETGHQ